MKSNKWVNAIRIAVVLAMVVNLLRPRRVKSS
jgi:hypothetical protein